MIGIADSLIAAILYATGKKLYWKFRDPLIKAIENTSVHFSKEKGIELDERHIKELLNKDIAVKELSAFKRGDKFIDGKELALQFAIFSGFYHEDDNQILKIAEEVFDYFKIAFTNELLKNPAESIQNLNNIIGIHFDISGVEHENIRNDLGNFRFTLETRLSSIDQNIQILVRKSDEEEKQKEIEDSIRTKYADYKIANLDFWEKTRENSDKEHLYLYYTNTDSSPVRLLDVIANDYYVVNHITEGEITRLIESGLSNQRALIKIISKGGEGKSTFLFHLAKRYSLKYNVVIIDDLNRNVLINLEKELHNYILTKPFLFLLDNPSLFEDELIQLTPKLISAFRKYGLVLIVAEREFRYENFEDRIEFENNFNHVYEIKYIAQNLKENIFDKMFSLFLTNYDVPEYVKDDAKRIYFQDKRKSLSESTFAVIKEIVKRTGIKFIFDWIDWEKFTNEREPKLNELYLIIATFYQFGFSLPINFCIKFLKDVNRRTIIKFIGESNNLPVYLKRDHLFLRHETIATWYINDTENTQKMSLDLFNEFLNKIETEFDKDLLIWIYKHKEFQKSPVSRILNDERQIVLLKKYIERNNNELKCRIELSKILQKQNLIDEAQEILLVLLSVDPNNLHARTELAKIYQHQGKYVEAEKLLMESLAIDEKQLHPRTELAKIYQHQKKYAEAEKVLSEILKINHCNCYAIAKLIKVYAKIQKPEKCFEMFEVFLEECKLEKKRRREPQAMFNNIFRLCSQNRRGDKAKQYFDNYSHLLDDRNVSLYYRYFG
jgi:Tfp pilus assembly protein PilF